MHLLNPCLQAIYLLFHFFFQDFGSFSLSLFGILYQVDSLPLCLVWWAFILFLCLLGSPLSLHLVYIAEFGVALCILSVCGVLFIVDFLHCGYVLWVACHGFLFRKACVPVLVGGAGFLLSEVQ